MYGDEVSHIFTIEIAPTKNVAALKEAIKEKNKPTLDHLSAIVLDL
jgi:hypothetical protein